MPGAVPIHVFDTSHADEIAAEVRAGLARRGERREVIVLRDRGALEAALGSIGVLLAPRPPRDGWAPATRLHLVQMMGAGVDGLLPSPDLPERVVVAGARGIFAGEVCEHVMAALLAWVRGQHTLAARQRACEWRPFAARTLAGSSVCIVGLGAVGGRVARACAALEMRVRGVSRGAGWVEHVDRVWRAEERLDALAGAEHVVVCAPLTDATRGLVGARELAVLAPGAYVVHVSRGGVLDEAALRESLATGHVGGAALDVFDAEPLAADSAWWTAPNVAVTPHVAGLGRDYVRRVVERLLDNVERLETDGEVLGRVDRVRGY